MIRLRNDRVLFENEFSKTISKFCSSTKPLHQTEPTTTLLSRTIRLVYMAVAFHVRHRLQLQGFSHPVVPIVKVVHSNWAFHVT